MNRKEFNKTFEDFHKLESRLKSLNPGDIIYESANECIEYKSYYKHKVVSVDLEEMVVNTLDMSQKVMYKYGKPRQLKYFNLPSEINL